MHIDTDFPGGNIVVERIEGDTAFVRQDLRDTEGDWFYWYFRVLGAEGRAIAFQFTGSNVLGVRGPACSTDGGKNWAWLGAESVKDKAFTFSFPKAAHEVRFSFCVPYLEADLRGFLASRSAHPHLREETLCRTNKGRPVEFLRAGRLDGRCAARVLLTCRHHACESVPNFTLEGLLDAVLAEDETGAWFRERAEFGIVPFIDKDGVEDGDQGKNRRPHDHNRDYAGESLYPSVRALKARVPQWSEGKLRGMLDLHCPWIRGRHSEDIYLVGTANSEMWTRTQAFSEVLERTCRGPLPYRKADNLPFGQAWNTYDGPLKTSQRWAQELPGMVLASSMEIPYANAGGATVTGESARAFGRDLALALKQFLSGLE